ncbi:hypothetical protein LZ30DRAFT_740456 [Colletotrichum cereale]|nr:hypothetical protein LZ30DRAFT_740456 [Colletotrichum cereale]
MRQPLSTYPSNHQRGQQGSARQMKPTARPMIFNNPLGTLTDQRGCVRLVSVSRLRGTSAMSLPSTRRVCCGLTTDKRGNQMATDVNRKLDLSDPAHLPSHLVLSRHVTSRHFASFRQRARLGTFVSVSCLPDCGEGPVHHPYPFRQGKLRRGSGRWERLRRRCNANGGPGKERHAMRTTWTLSPSLCAALCRTSSSY